MNTENQKTSEGVRPAAVESGPPYPIKSGDDDFTPRYLEAEKIRLFRSPMGSPRLEIQGEVCYPRVTVWRILPLSDPEHYISLGVGEDKEIGIIQDPSQLDAESLTILREELDKRYFTPVIQKIYHVKERFGVHEWEVETSRGKLTFSVQGLHQNIKHVPPARLLVTDVRGNRYDIPDYHKLDSHSFDQIQRHL
ncbi:MAG: DUF1854 domain-containing protein [Candidatus Poribacteria bacterium]|nr:DUF1854 domain-containing protein [Candidatus Poribacteria bacterium]